MLAKLLLMNAAASITGGIISNLPDTLPLDVDIKSPDTQAENLMAFRVCHVLYDGLARALDPATGWQTPAALAELELPDLQGGAPLVQSLAGLAGKLGVAPDLVKVLSQLVAAIPAPTVPRPPSGGIPTPADSVSK